MAKCLQKFLLDSIVFIVWGFALMSFYEYVNDGLKEQVNAVFFESISVKSIVSLMLMGMFLVGLFLVIFGGKGRDEQKYRRLFYRRGVAPVLELGLSFSSASFGMIVGLAVIVAMNGYLQSMALFGAAFLMFVSYQKL